MKSWNSYGSEHSSDLILIGSFKDAGSAQAAQDTIEKITEFMSGRSNPEEVLTRYSDDVIEFLMSINSTIVRPDELEQFTYGIRTEASGNVIKIRTDECDLSGFIKLMVHNGARVEIFSAHSYPQPGDEE